MYKHELIRNVKLDKYRVKLWDLHRFSGDRQYLRYELRHNGRIIFASSDLKPSPLHSCDSDETMISLLSFLSLKPGDTDIEYFDDYTPAQLEFAENETEYLNLICMNMEEINKKLKESEIENIEDLIFDIKEALEDHKQYYHQDMGEYLEIRLQVLPDDTYQLHTGSPTYDTDHSGVWTEATISFKADYYDIYLAALELIKGNDHEAWNLL